MAVLGALLVLVSPGLDLARFLLPVAAGGFLYIACADLVPEMRKRARGRRLLTTFLALLAGVGLMAGLRVLEAGSGHEGHGHGHEQPGHEHR
jgi:zinc and cadmium transporter